MGFADDAALLAVLDAHREVVSRHFDSVFGDPSGRATASMPPGPTRATPRPPPELGELGYRRPARPPSVSPRCTPARAIASCPTTSGRFDALMPRVLEAAASTPGADETLARMLDLIEAIGRRGAYLALLQQYPQALRRVAT